MATGSDRPLSCSNRSIWRSAGREVQAVERSPGDVERAPIIHDRLGQRLGPVSIVAAVSDISGREPGRASARGRGFRLRQALEIGALARARPRSRRDKLRLAWSRASGGWPATAAPRHARPLKHFRVSRAGPAVPPTAGEPEGTLEISEGFTTGKEPSSIWITPS